MPDKPLRGSELSILPGRYAFEFAERSIEITVAVETDPITDQRHPQARRFEQVARQVYPSGGHVRNKAGLEHLLKPSTKSRCRQVT